MEVCLRGLEEGMQFNIYRFGSSFKHLFEKSADYSEETTAMAKSQILSQASTAMLAQANQAQQNVLSLLK